MFIYLLCGTLFPRFGRALSLHLQKDNCPFWIQFYTAANKLVQSSRNLNSASDTAIKSSCLNSVTILFNDIHNGINVFTACLLIFSLDHHADNGLCTALADKNAAGLSES